LKPDVKFIVTKVLIQQKFTEESENKADD